MKSERDGIFRNCNRDRWNKDEGEESESSILLASSQIGQRCTKFFGAG